MNSRKTSLIITGIILLVALSRLLPHPFNFTPVGAMALFGGRYLSSKILKFLVPIGSLFLSDFIINNFIFRSFFPDQEGFIFFSEYMIWSYAAFSVIVLIGWLLMKKNSISSILTISLLYSIAFFLISNFGVWLSGSGLTYPRSASGLLSCMMAGVPFFKWTLIGNLIYTPILFYSYEYFFRTEDRLQKVHL